MTLRTLCVFFIASATSISLGAAETRLLRQPTISASHIAFAYGGDIWTVDREGGRATRITSTPAIEENPHFSPDGQWLAFSSNRSGSSMVYVVSADGGTPTRLTWYPAASHARGWTPDGKRVLYSTSRETAPVGYDRLWSVSVDGGPSELLPAPWGFDGSFSASGKRIVVDRVTRWDTEWRHYRGGQNTALTVLNLESLKETRIPNERTTDTQPLWLGGKVYFLSDRDWVMNIWAYDTRSQKLEQLTEFEGSDIKWLGGKEDTLVFEREGYLHTFDLESKKSSRIEVEVVGDFPWAETRWEDVEDAISDSSLSATGKRALFQARGEIFTVPVENGSTRNLTQSSGAADRAPTWSPNGDEIAWFSDDGSGYKLLVTNQDGREERREIDIGESKMAWETTWSPDGSRIAFVDDDLRIRVVEMESGKIQTVDTGGMNISRGSMGLTWSPDSNWLAYAKYFENNLRRIVVWSLEEEKAYVLTDSMADAASPTWDRDGKHLYFLASTDVALASGWANTSQMTAEPRYGVYVILLDGEEESPFTPESDEEEVEEDSEEDSEEEDSEEQDKADEDGEEQGVEEAQDDEGAAASEEENDHPEDKKAKRREKRRKKKEAATQSKEEGQTQGSGAEEDAQQPSKEEDNGEKDGGKKESEEEEEDEGVEIDREFLERRVLALPLPVADYRFTIAGPEGSVFIYESSPSGPPKLHKFVLEDQESSVFLTGAGGISVSSDGKKMLYRAGAAWQVTNTGGPEGKGESLNLSMQMQLDRSEEWQQIFDEAWRYMRDFFYDPNMHGRDWDIVRERYAPLVAHVRHRGDLTYLLDQMSGEMSVGHSFVFGGDYPEIDRRSRVGLLGADLVAANGLWQIDRIYTFESWNPNLTAPLDRPGLKVKEGYYLLEVNGVALTDAEDPYKLLDGTAGQQTTLRLSEEPDAEDSWTVLVEPARGESSLRQRAWVEDNRRRVEELSDGKLAYVWVPNTGQPGVISFNRYFFAQQDKQGAVIDERYNGGGLLDDYMVDLMTRKLRAAITNEVPNGRPFRLPAGLLGPKVLLINERAGSGGDFFPWVFRQQQAGPLIGTRTWGGLVKSSVHYPFLDGGAMTAPDNAVFDPIHDAWIGENQGIPPDIEVLMDAKSVAEGKDPQLERGVEELLKLLEDEPAIEVQVPEYPTPALKK